MTNKSNTTTTNINSNTSSFAQDITKMIRRYKKYCLYITRLLEETDKSYNEINEKRVLTSGV
jgi:hypothetical protein